MFERVYRAGENARRKDGAIAVIRALVDHHLASPAEIPRSYRDNDADLVTQVADYVAGMTDRFALAQHDRLFRPRLFDPAPLPGEPS
jgi:dGTPase